MKRAAQPAVFQPAEGKIGTAMGAMAVDQPVAALFVAEQHQVFAEQFDGLDRPLALQFIDQRRWLPVHPHQLAARISAASAGDQVVRFLAHHGGDSVLDSVRLLNYWANYDMSGRTGKPVF